MRKVRRWVDLFFVASSQLVSTDSPLDGECSVNEQRDCGNGQCIRKWCDMASYDLYAGHSRKKPVTAIANYTVRVVEKSLSAEQTMEALLFLGELALSVWLGR